MNKSKTIKATDPNICCVCNQAEGDVDELLVEGWVTFCNPCLDEIERLQEELMNDAHIKLTEEIYLRWFNDYLTVGTFADHYGWSTDTANYVINAGRTINHQENTDE